MNLRTRIVVGTLLLPFSALKRIAIGMFLALCVVLWVCGWISQEEMTEIDNKWSSRWNRK